MTGNDITPSDIDLTCYLAECEANPARVLTDLAHNLSPAEIALFGALT